MARGGVPDDMWLGRWERDGDEEGSRWGGRTHLSVAVDSEFQTGLVVCQGRM